MVSNQVVVLTSKERTSVAHLPNVVKARVLELHGAIGACIQNDLILPALVLIYSGIDSMAWLARAEDHADVVNTDFTNWVDVYLLPGSGLTCSAADLYGARCGVLHSSSPESRRSREGRAKRLYYVYGGRSASTLQAMLDQQGEDATAVHLTELYKAFSLGVMRFLMAVEADEVLCQLIENRAQLWFSNVQSDRDLPTVAADALNRDPA